MKKILLVIMGISITVGLISCAVQYDMTKLKKLNFNKPDNWQEIDAQDDYTYDYAFRFQSDEALFEVYLRTLYFPKKSATRWLLEEQAERKKRGYGPNKIVTLATKWFNWYLLETEDEISHKGKEIQIKVRQYAAKEEKSPRLVQCYFVGEKNKFVKLQENEVNTFLNSITLEEIKTPWSDSENEYYKNYFTSAEERDLLMNSKSYYKKAEYKRAIAVLNALRQRQATRKLQAEVYYLLSECYLEMGIPLYLDSQQMQDFRQAIAYAKQALEQKRSYWRPYFNIGLAHMNMAEYAEAKKNLKRALKFCDKNNSEYPLIRFHYAIANNPLRYKQMTLSIFGKPSKIDGIMYDETDPFVMISGKHYRLQETIGDYTIMKITRNKVYLKLGHRIDDFSTGNIIPQMQKQAES